VKNIALLITTPIALLAIVVLIVQRAGNPTEEYDTYNDLKVSGRIPGWLPAYLPASAVRVKLRQHLDNGSIWATFEYQAGDIEGIEGACQLIAETKFGKKFLCPPHEKKTTTIRLMDDGQAYYSSIADGI
jgi:hypothetical protein